ncbi:MAG: hypothetical protein LC685_00575 [Actinobacteria bacterium]|nr:hypothetical protein [Actinomycetota bacterium]
MAAGNELHVEVVPWGPSPAATRAVARAALEHPSVRAELGDADTRLLRVVPVVASSDAGAEPDHVRATVYDYMNERAVVVDAPVDGGAHVSITSTAKQPLPSRDEFAAAVEAVQADEELGAAIADGRLVPYRPMPPIVVDEHEDGSVARTISVGLRPAGEDGGAHQIVGVRAATGEVRHFEGGAPRAALAVEQMCGLPYAEQETAEQGDAGAAKITVTRGGEVLWSFIAVRPAASTGTNGSGIELRSVSYKGKRVFRRAHVPILNVRYDNDACGPYRDWQYQEGMINAVGSDPAPGFRLCTQPAKTIFDSGSDTGNFLGVAVYVEGDEVVLVSELEAGWYRYISLWRLGADGTIKPRFMFGAVENSCVCNVHHHHVYWRFDFDIVSAEHNAVREFNDPLLDGHTKHWHTLRHETRRANLTERKRKWRVVNRVSGEHYTLIPGPEDGKRDSFGIGDLWALRRRPNAQIDDGIGFTSDLDEARAHLNQFVNGEAISDTDVVLWYAAHFSHDIHAQEEEGEDHGHIVGPDLVPGGW